MGRVCQIIIVMVLVLIGQWLARPGAIGYWSGFSTIVNYLVNCEGGGGGGRGHLRTSLARYLTSHLVLRGDRIS